MSLRDPVTLSEPWVLSEEKEKNPVSISHNVLKNFGRQDIVVLNFLYQSYTKQLNGVILNEEEDLNPQLQVSSFLGALYTSLKNRFLVLILCPDDLIIKWHYYMSQCGTFEVKIVKPSTVPEDFDQEAGIVLLLSFTNIKLAEYLKGYDFFSVVIDHFDEVATKLFIRKLQGNFNIGVTSRNFYEDPNQKLQWTMLNWTNPGCVGKLADFYEIDNDNFANFRDNYKEWWFRLTWSYCDSFVKPALEETSNLNTTLKNWGITHNLIANYRLQRKKNPTNTKRKVRESPEVKVEDVESEDKQNKQPKKVYKKNNEASKTLKPIPHKSAADKRANTKNKQNFRNLDIFSDSSDSNDTIICENESYSNLADNAMEALDSDEPPLGPVLPVKLENDDLSEQNEKFQENSDDSVSSGEQLLCSLVRIKEEKSPRATESIVKQECQNVCDNFDESDLFLKSVATTNSDLSPVKVRQEAEKFFEKILKTSGDKPDLKRLTQMEMELSDKEVLDVPSESDSFFEVIFNGKSRNDLSNRNATQEAENCSQSSTASFQTGDVDVDTLVAEVMEMVGEK